MPTILDPGTVRFSNADVLDWIARKRTQHASEAAEDKAAGRKKTHLADNYQRALRKHERELTGRKYPNTDNPGAYKGDNRIKAVSVFAETLDERVLYPAEDRARAEGGTTADITRRVKREQDIKGLTETEHLQIYNLAPQCVETLQNIIGDWEERFTAEEMETLLGVVNEVYRCGESMPGAEGTMDCVPKTNGDGERLEVSQAALPEQHLPDRSRDHELETTTQNMCIAPTRRSERLRNRPVDYAGSAFYDRLTHELFLRPYNRSFRRPNGYTVPQMSPSPPRGFVEPLSPDPSESQSLEPRYDYLVDYAGSALALVHDQEMRLQDRQARTPPPSSDPGPQRRLQDFDTAPGISTIARLAPQRGRPLEANTQPTQAVAIPTKQAQPLLKLHEAGLLAGAVPNRVMQTQPANDQLAPQSSRSAARSITSVPKTLKTSFVPTFQRDSTDALLSHQDLAPQCGRTSYPTTSHQPSHQFSHHKQSPHQQAFPQSYAPTPNLTQTQQSRPRSPPCDSPPPRVQPAIVQPHTHSPPPSPDRNRSLSTWSQRMLKSHIPPASGPGAGESYRKSAIEDVERTGIGLTGANAFPIGGFSRGGGFGGDGVGEAMEDEERKEAEHWEWRYQLWAGPLDRRSGGEGMKRQESKVEGESLEMDGDGDGDGGWVMNAG